MAARKVVEGTGVPSVSVPALYGEQSSPTEPQRDERSPCSCVLASAIRRDHVERFLLFRKCPTYIECGEDLAPLHCRTFTLEPPHRRVSPALGASRRWCKV
jgi:hypothetical protein